MALSVLIIDDEEDIGWFVKKSLNSRGIDARFTVTPEEGLMQMRYAPDIVLLDYMMPGMDGLEVLQHIKKDNPQQIVIMMTAFGSVENAVEAMTLGAFHYIQKPFKMDELMLHLRRAQEMIEMRRVISLADNTPENSDMGYLDGKSSSMKEIYKRAKKVAGTPNTAVLILGENGTGKEMLARTIHDLSDRRDNPFVPINCSAIPENLLESELFGYEPGAFTDAKKRKIGQFEVADKGTIFLDEIGDMPLALQVKLLRVLEDYFILRLGSNDKIKVDVRVIAASNKNLDDLVENNLFREDLLYRLQRFVLKMPSLKDRGDDVIQLTMKFIDQFNKELKKNIKGIDPQVAKIFRTFNWPGNVRQLKNTIESAMIECEEDVIRECDLPLKVREGVSRKASEIADDLLKTGITPLEEVKNQYILKVLGICRTDEEAASALGISRRTITRFKQDFMNHK